MPSDNTDILYERRSTQTGELRLVVRAQSTPNHAAIDFAEQGVVMHFQHGDEMWEMIHWRPISTTAAHLVLANPQPLGSFHAMQRAKQVSI